jgi:cytochrome c oxidase subunit IV
MANQHADHHAPAAGVAHPPSEQAHATEHHPGWKTYVIVGAILTLITAIEVSAYYTPAWETSRIYVPSMLFLSALKFVIVVMFYMHLKYDHKLFRALFSGPLAIAVVTIIALLILFGQIGSNLRG